jgi:hypothetical protein
VGLARAASARSPDHFGPGGAERLRAGRQKHLAAVDLAEQFGQVGRHQIDGPDGDGLPGRHRNALHDGPLDPVAAAAAEFGKGPGPGHGVVDRLRLRRRGCGRIALGSLAAVGAGRLAAGRSHRQAAERHGVGRADVGARGHRGHVGGDRDEHAGRGGPAAGRGDVDHDRHGARENRLDEDAGGIDEATGRVEHDHEALSLAVGGRRDGPLQEPNGSRGDGLVFEAGDEHLRRSVGSGGPGDERQQADPPSEPGPHRDQPRRSTVAGARSVLPEEASLAGDRRPDRRPRPRWR